ncbi:MULTISPECIES: MFS transporter [Thermogemmatispora]|jgi:MFS family permease|uniref:MFS transporter n=1 Tax=Thermogemmatispora TaxID=768669 RepID=UPI00124D3E33|nr:MULTISPECIES: MFS transporter [Thermogemmatispora]
MSSRPDLSQDTARSASRPGDGPPGNPQGDRGSRQNLLSWLQLPRDVYLLLFYTLGKGFQLTIGTLDINYYAHSLGYQPDFIGLLSALPALGSLISAVPSGMLADRLGYKPVLLASALSMPFFLAMIGLTSAAPLMLLAAFFQGVASAAYWVTNVPLLIEKTSEERRVGVLALNSFVLLGIGSLGNLLGGAIPELVACLLQVSANSVLALRWGVLSASLVSLLFGLPLWWLRSAPPRASHAGTAQVAKASPPPEGAGSSSSATGGRFPLAVFVKLLVPDLIFNMGEGAVIALIQLFFVLRFSLLPGPLGVIFTISGLAGGLFSLTAPLFVHRWRKIKIITTVMYASAPLMLLIGYSPILLVAVLGEYTRSFLRLLIEPVYTAFAMEQVSERYRGRLSGFYSVTWSVGYSLGPTVAGWLQTYVNLSAAFLFAAICLVIAASLLLAAFGRRPVSAPDPR